MQQLRTIWKVTVVARLEFVQSAHGPKPRARLGSSPTDSALAVLSQGMALPRPRPYERQLSRDSTTGGVAHSLPPLWEDSDLAAVRAPTVS